MGRTRERLQEHYAVKSPKLLEQSCIEWEDYTALYTKKPVHQQLF